MRKATARGAAHSYRVEIAADGASTFYEETLRNGVIKWKKLKWKVTWREGGGYSGGFFGVPVLSAEGERLVRELEEKIKAGGGVLTGIAGIGRRR